MDLMEFEFDLEFEDQLRSLVRTSVLRESARFGLDSSLVCAIIYQESYKGCKNFIEACFAVRYEDGFYERYLNGKALVGLNPNYAKVSRATERRMRAASFGCMQIMLQTARESGFSHVYAPALCWPTANIYYGCKILARNLKKYGIVNGIRRYNGSLDNSDTLIYYENVQSHIETGRYLEITG